MPLLLYAPMYVSEPPCVFVQGGLFLSVLRTMCVGEGQGWWVGTTSVSGVPAWVN
jgi:hypothetical protein